MRAALTEVEESAVVSALAEGWGFEAESAEYAAVGAGSYHWLVTAADGQRGFVTVDDLDGKLWLGDAREPVFQGLKQAFDTARALRDHGLPFVVAPMPTSDAETLRRIGARHTVALFPFVDGAPGRYGDSTAGERAAVFHLLAQLHASTAAAKPTAPSVGVGIPGRRRLDAALQELDRPWSGGPLSEPARRALAPQAPVIAELLGLADRLAAEVDGDWVVTHGEPHPANVLRTAEGYVLVDWDTVSLAPPERDLWMVVGAETAVEAEAYTRATGREIDPVAVDLFTLTWDLKDLAEYLHLLRLPHRRNEDTTQALGFVGRCASIRERWTAHLD